MADTVEGEGRDVLPTDLVIRVNVTLTNDPCALCGEPTDPTGIDLYLAERPALVCHACGFLHAPALVRLLDLASAANTFVRAEYEMSGVQSDEKHS
jgi:recombinational DNA repair protein (RecF pathway)